MLHIKFSEILLPKMPQYSYHRNRQNMAQQNHLLEKLHRNENGHNL